LALAHIEAGLRSYEKDLPEETNRIFVDHLATLLFCPSRQAVMNLKKEGLPKERIFNVGDCMYDSLLYALRIARKKEGILKKLGMRKGRYYLFTLHRQANVEKKKNFERIINFINKVSSAKITIFPMHPRTKKSYQNIRVKFSPQVKIIRPLGYLETIVLLANSQCLFTDSGGMQKEAYWLGVPCVTLREKTEWPETLKGGWNVLLKNYHGFNKPKIGRKRFYGSGNAAERAVDIIIKWQKNLLLS